MKYVLFLLADLWLMYTGFRYGWRFLKQYGNHLLGFEWLLVASSGTNFLVWALLSGNESSPLYHLAGVLDAFSRSIGITLVLVLGLMAVTHRYKPPVAVEIGVVVLGFALGAYLGQFLGDDLHVGPATFYVVVNLLTAAFLATVAKRLWELGDQRVAVETAAVTAAATFVAVVYDFFPFGFDDADRTWFYVMALTVWGTQGLVYFRAYRSLHERQAAATSPLGRPSASAHDGGVGVAAAR